MPEGAFAPSGALRPSPTAVPRCLSRPKERIERLAARYHWAILLAPLFATFPLLCPQCGEPLSMIAFVSAAEPVARILTHQGEPASRIATDRGSPARDDVFSGKPA